MSRVPNEPDPSASLWRGLSWDDLGEWAGAKTLARGKSYANGQHVSKLARTADGGLLAWVRGTERYATAVCIHAANRDGDTLTSECSCPVGWRCKHAVAVILTYLDALKKGEAVPTAREDDPRLEMIRDGGGEEDEEYDDYEDEGEDPDAYEEEQRQRAKAAAASRGAVAPPSNKPRVSKTKKSEKPPTVAEYLDTQSEEQLRALLVVYAARHPEVRDDLNERAVRTSGNATALVKDARKEMRRVTAQEAWRSHWSGDGHLPDYGGLKRRFDALFEMGEYDALLDLGRDLLDLGTAQVEQSDDEGETASAIAECLDVTFRAVPRSSLPAADKLLYAFDMAGNDEYDLAGGSATVLEADWSKADWSAVADTLRDRLPAFTGGGEEFTRSYKRDRATNAVIDALDRAGRHAEGTELCEAEAPRTHSYQRVVERLMSVGRDADAERWAKEGIEATRAKYPGIASHLRDRLTVLAVKRKDFPTVAAYQAEKFFEQPSVPGLKELLTAAKKAGCEPAVKAAALHFLETGVRPNPTPAEPGKKSGKVKAVKPGTAPVWPLPQLWAPSAPKSDSNRIPGYAGDPGPNFAVLIDLALSEGRTTDALAYYDRWTGGEKGRFSFGFHYATRVADAIADTHPDRALAIYKADAEKLIAQTSPSAYQSARTPLKKARDLLVRQSRAKEWAAYEAELRAKNARKTRFLEVLNAMNGKKIVDG